MGEKLAAFKRSRAGQFVQKVQDDRAPNLAVLLAWGTLNTMLPLLLGILAIVGLIIRDPKQLDSLTGTLLAVLPEQAATAIHDILAQSRQSAGVAGIISLLLLLFTGTNFFANMQMVFNLAYHIEDRNIIMQRVVALIMLILVTALLLISTTAYGIGNTIGSLPIALPVGPVLGRLLGWLISLVSALAMFLLLYKILPNKSQGWKQALPGAVAAAVLFFVILQVFPLYLAVFGKGFAAYQAFGVFLVLMFWLFLLGLVLVGGAELNAFLEQPGRSTALAASKAKAEKGQVETSEEGGEVRAEATGVGVSGGEETGGGAAEGRPGAFGRPAAQKKPAAGQPAGAGGQAGGGGGGGSSLPGKLIGLVGLAVAAFLLRGQLPTGPAPSRH